MKVRIAKTFDFDAAHFLPNVPDGRGFVVDYAELAAAWGPIHGVIDHRLLNEVPGLENPTTEVLAPWILERLTATVWQVEAVRVYESSSTWCEVSREEVERGE